MLKLKDITKTYVTGDLTQRALDGINVSFRKSEFVSILGQSGSGKTTMLNIIGGLDGYTDGDLIINGKSTKDFTDADWDAYRNHSVGFVFQSYNLIPHQTVLQNVELSLTLSGVSKSERRRRAKEALEKVGLGDQLHKKPNQMSGGQMQRVAIARALINDPEILLADEPTGALDSETSVQVLELLKEISSDRLVIMVTHNPELAERYSTRIVKLLDGHITDDSDPYEDETPAPPPQSPKERCRERKASRNRSMSFVTALSLSLNNLMTKKGRTALTSFAGSIGIIGIALILSLSTGINAYIAQIQEETLSSYPITIEGESVDMTAMLSDLMGANRDEDSTPHEEDRVYASNVMFDLLNAMFNAQTTENNMRAFKEYLDNGGGGIAELAQIRYGYNFSFDVYNMDADGTIVKSDLTELIQEAMSSMYGGDYSAYFDSMGGFYENMNVWTELMPGSNGEAIDSSVLENYDLLYGSWPENMDEVILFVDSENEISDLMLYALGLLPQEQMTETLSAMQAGEEVDGTEDSWSYQELCDETFKLILPAERYQYDSSSGQYVDLSQSQAGLELLYGSSDTGITLKIVGIARPSEDSGMTLSTGAVGYLSSLTEYAISTCNDTDIVKAQLDDPDTDVITGLPFPTEGDTEPTAEEKASDITEYLSSQDDTLLSQAYVAAMGQPENSYVDQMVSSQMEGITRDQIEEMIAQQYAGQMQVSTDTVMNYISDMSNEELFSQVEEAVAQEIRNQYAAAVEQELSSLPASNLAAMMRSALSEGSFTTEQYEYLYDNYMPPTVSDSTYQENLDRLGYVDLDNPSTISIYASTFSDKDRIADLITEYNESVENEDDQITYTDYIALLMSSITDIINAISYLLIGFVAISLIVSSIMIGIITYISVLERTKEIGILRAVGASKRDISRVFNAETLIVGLGAGIIGIGVTLLLIIPINIVVHNLTGIYDLSAVLPTGAAVILVAISTVLTMISGLIPSRIAAKKDPVDALRSE